MSEQSLPSGWAWATLAEVGAWYGGGTPSKRKREFWDEGLIPWLSPKDMGEPTLAATRDHVTEHAISGSSTKLVPAGSIAIVVRSGILERRLPIALVPFATTMNQDMKAIVPNSAILASWLRYALMAEEPTLLRNCRKDGTTVASIDTTRLMGWRLPVPPLAEQHRIVDSLEDHFSRLDAAEMSLQQARLRTCTLRATSVTAALDDPVEPLCTDVRTRLTQIYERRLVLATRRRDQPTPPAYSLDLPPGWVTASVDQLCWSIQYGTSSKAHLGDSGSDIPVLRMGNIQDGEIDITDLKYLDQTHPGIGNLLLEPGDLLFNRTNSAELVGKTAVFTGQLPRATFASYLIRCRTVPGVSPEWISLVANGPIGRRYIESVMSQQVGQANVNGTKLAAMPIPITSAEAEQTLLGEVVELRTTAAKLRGESDRLQNKVAAIRRSLLRAAFAGELVDQDPPSKPAAASYRGPTDGNS